MNENRKQYGAKIVKKTLKFYVHAYLYNKAKENTVKILLPLDEEKLSRYCDYKVLAAQVARDDFTNDKSLFDHRLFSGTESLKKVNDICWQMNCLTEANYLVQALQIMTLGYKVSDSLKCQDYDYHAVSLETFGHRVLATVNFKLCGLSPFASNLIKESLNYHKFFRNFLDSKELVETDRGIFVKTSCFAKRLLYYC